MRWTATVFCGLAIWGGVARSDAPDLNARARASLSTIAGSIRVPGLRSRVRVLRDRFGIPHIYAKTAADLFFAQGFVQAQDRLFQMELWRRSTQGRLAELLGPRWVERDRMTRLVTRYRGDMKVEWESYDPEALPICQSFVQGINAYVDSVKGRPPLESVKGRPPLEFELLGMGLERWKAEDLLARAEAFGMSGNARNEVSRAQLLRILGRDAAFSFAPIDPPVTPSIPAGFDPAAVPDALGVALGLIGGAARVAGEDEGSNNWALSGRRTTTGRPLLANDPHRALDHPSLRYLVHLNAPGWNVIGAVVPWFPGVAIGHNERVAWGLTIFQIDAQDLFEEELDARDPLRYRTPEGWATMVVHRETIPVKGGPPVVADLKYTRHGPVVHEDPERRRAYALRWTGSEPGTAGYLAALALDRARTGAEFRQAARRWKMPGENFVWADAGGSIGYQATGLAPRRRPGSGLVPAPGAGGEYDWNGFLDPDDLPHAIDPAEGFVATANHNTLSPGYDHAIGYEWSPGFRIERIREALRAKPRMDMEDMQLLQLDTASLVARDLVPLVAGLEFDDERLRQARDLLARWDLRLDRDSPAAALFVVFSDVLHHERTSRRLGTTAPENLRKLVPMAVVIREMKQATSAAPLRAALLAAVEELTRLQGPTPNRWRWGALHQATFRHFLSSDPARRALFDRGPFERPGDDETVNSTYRGGGDRRQTGGASFRQIIDVGDWDRSVAISTPGQSGQPESPHYDDLIPYWLEGRYVPLAFGRKKVEELTADRLALEPAR